MLIQNRKLRQAAGFYTISLTLAILLAAPAPHLGRVVLLLTMFTPAIAVVLCRVLSPEGKRFRLAEVGLSCLGLRYWPFALVVPVVAILPGYLLVWGTGIGSVAELPADANPFQMAVSFTLSIVFGAAIGALGEEVGWRGYMLPRLIEALGTGKASLLTGFLHGLWHVPLIVLTPYYLADAPALIIVPLFLTLLTLTGPVFTYLRLASGSILPIALMHHAWNGYWETLAGITTGENAALIAYLSGESGIASIAMLAVICLWLWRRQPESRLAGVI